MNVRKTALSLLRDAEAGDKYIALTLDGYLNANPCDARDRALLSTLVYGVTEEQLRQTLCRLISQKDPNLYAVITVDSSYVSLPKEYTP